MALGVVIIGIVVLIVAIYILFEVKRMKHKLFAFFLIALILFGFFSFNLVFKGEEIPLNNITDLGNAAKLYFNWVVYAFNNVKVLTANVVEMDWDGNETA
jgi:hypothetical protein